MKILIINGKPRTGKSTFCEAAAQKCGLVYHYSTITEIKRLAKLIGWDGNKDAKGRKLLSDLKDVLSEYSDLPHQHLKRIIKGQCEKYKYTPEIANNLIFLIESREPEDIKRWREECNAKAVLIKDNSELDDQVWSNHADDEVFNCTYDYVIDNNESLEDWKETAGWFIHQIKREKWESHI